MPQGHAEHPSPQPCAFEREAEKSPEKKARRRKCFVVVKAPENGAQAADPVSCLCLAP